MALTAVLAAGFLAGGYAARKNLVSPGIFFAKSSIERVSREEELKTGAILYVPLEGNVCRLRLIDNDTWTIRDAGNIECDEAVSWNSGNDDKKYFVAVRVDAIRAGFRTK